VSTTSRIDVSPRSATPIVDPTAAAEEALSEFERGRGRPYYAASSDKAAQTEYYADIPRRASRRRFYEALSELVTSTHTTELPYKPMKHVYPWVDLRSDRQLRSIYSGKEFDPQELIVAEAQIEAERSRIVQERIAQEGDLSEEQRLELEDFLEAAAPFNCEHVVPQSWFEKREPMRGDLHHLFCCEWGCNSFRGNTPYFDFDDFEEATRNDCGKREALCFEPSAGKGAVARATLYFLLRYPDEINAVANEYQAERIETLLDWHDQDRVDTYERHRNAAIFEVQGNRNPLIDHPEWARKMDFKVGLGD
jgi:endonuclease I